MARAPPSPLHWRLPSNRAGNQHILLPPVWGGHPARHHSSNADVSPLEEIGVRGPFGDSTASSGAVEAGVSGRRQMWPILDQLTAPQATKERGSLCRRSSSSLTLRDLCPGSPALVPKRNLLRRGLSITPSPGSVSAAAPQGWLGTGGCSLMLLGTGPCVTTLILQGWGPCRNKWGY